MLTEGRKGGKKKLSLHLLHFSIMLYTHSSSRAPGRCNDEKHQPSVPVFSVPPCGMVSTSPIIHALNCCWRDHAEDCRSLQRRASLQASRWIQQAQTPALCLCLGREVVKRHQKPVCDLMCWSNQIHVFTRAFWSQNTFFFL